MANYSNKTDISELAAITCQLWRKIFAIRQGRASTKLGSVAVVPNSWPPKVGSAPSAHFIMLTFQGWFKLPVLFCGAPSFPSPSGKCEEDRYMCFAKEKGEGRCLHLCTAHLKILSKNTSSEKRRYYSAFAHRIPRNN